METPLEIYRRRVADLPPCDAAFFREALARYRAGDESAARDISGRCLALALRFGEERARELGSFETLDAVQEANRGLWNAITTFPGGDLDDFLRHARERIRERLAALAQPSK